MLWSADEETVDPMTTQLGSCVWGPVCVKNVHKTRQTVVVAAYRAGVLKVWFRGKSLYSKKKWMPFLDEKHWTPMACTHIGCFRNQKTSLKINQSFKLDFLKNTHTKLYFITYKRLPGVSQQQLCCVCVACVVCILTGVFFRLRPGPLPQGYSCFMTWYRCF